MKSKFCKRTFSDNCFQTIIVVVRSCFDNLFFRQVIADQNNQETILDTLNTAETVVQSLEDNIVETCDVKQEMDDTKKTLKQTDAKQENHIQVEKERAEEKENEVKVRSKFLFYPFIQIDFSKLFYFHKPKYCSIAQDNTLFSGRSQVIFG